MSEPILASTSRSEDAGYLALADVASATGRLGADYRLIEALESLGYTRPGASNRFVRPVDDALDAVIDVLAPSYTGRHEPNQQHGNPRSASKVLRRFAAINSPALRQITSDRATHARIRALTVAVGGLAPPRR